MSTGTEDPIPVPPPPTPITQQNPNITAAAEEEQQRLSDVLRDAQANYLLNRCVELNARLRELNAQ